VRRRRRSLTVVAALAVLIPLRAQELGTVKVTVARANVRADASERAPVVTQVTLGTILTLKAIEGDWFRVQLPAMAGGLRVEAYISKKVSAIETLAPGAATPAATAPPGAPGSADAARVGVTVSQYREDGSVWLAPSDARVSQLSERGDSVRAIAALLPAEPRPPIDAGRTEVAYVWAVDAAGASRVIDEPRPVFIVQFKDIPGVSPDGLAPAIVRLTAAASGQRVVAMARGRADEIGRTAAEWDVVGDLRQDAVRSTVQAVERGTARIQPADALTPGEYAVVVRPARRRLAGATVLSMAGEGLLFGTAWGFTVK
jgi:hypothetical protein